MPTRILTEWKCDGCPSVLVIPHEAGLPIAWAVIEVHTQRSQPAGRAQILLCDGCLVPGTRTRAVDAILGEVLATESRDGRVVADIAGRAAGQQCGAGGDETCIFCLGLFTAAPGLGWRNRTVCESSTVDPFEWECTRPAGHGGQHVACCEEEHDMARWADPEASP